MSLWTAVREPLQGKTPLRTVFWVYGILGSVLLSAIGLFVDTRNQAAMWIYTGFGILFSIYVTVATYLCAGNCGSKFLARLVRISTVVGVLVLLPLCAYLYFSGALDLAMSLMQGEQ